MVYESPVKRKADAMGVPSRSSDNADDMELDNAKAGAAVVTSKAAAPTPQNAVVFSPQLLRVYYQRLFPFQMMYDWLSYGNDWEKGAEIGNERDFFGKREWSFTIQPTPQDEIYIRYQSFKDCAEFTAAVQKRQPNKIDIGAVFTHPPKDHNTIKSDVFHTKERELVFDIDLTDYDGVRTCCTGANICRKCWKYMNMAVKVMDEGLSKDFGFKNMVWFYSGRRGVHCWVCDESARELSNDARSAVATYFELPLENENKSMDLSPNLHPMLTRSFRVLEPQFIADIIGDNGMGILTNQKSWVKLLKTLPEGFRTSTGIAAELDRDCTKSAAQKWAQLKQKINQATKKQQGKSAANNDSKTSESAEMWIYETVYRHTYPRLDINVSKMQNHLLKSPFCIHPKTGRVCIPLNTKEIDSFDPFAVPTLPQIVSELDEYEKVHGKAAAAKVPDW
ncbi:hypothetical protein TrRE_jg3028, partial [Triparma retinervis]